MKTREQLIEAAVKALVDDDADRSTYLEIVVDATMKGLHD